MNKQFNHDPSWALLGSPEWPDNPTKVAPLFSARRPLRKLVVLVDANLIDVPRPADGTLDKATLLTALLDTDSVIVYRYTDGLPPIDSTPVEGWQNRAYAGWAVAYPTEASSEDWDVVYSVDPEKSVTLSGVTGNTVDLARSDDSNPGYPELDPNQRAAKRALDALALQVARQSVQADMFITERPYLYGGSGLVDPHNVTVCTRDEAIPLIALYLRTQGEFILPSSSDVKFRFNRGLYYWVGARELLPAAWRWFAACAQQSTRMGDEKLTLLGGSLLSRVTRALQKRDEMHVTLNQPTTNDLSDDALGKLDTVLYLLMGAVDVSARVAHHVLGLTGGEYNAAWQTTERTKKWRKQVAAAAPDLAAVTDPGTPGAHTLTILRLLRNSVHGAGLRGATYLLESGAEMRIGLPEEDEEKLLEAMGGRANWGVTSLGAGVNHVEPAILVETLFDTVVELLNNLMKETPVESLSHVNITAADCQPPYDNPATPMSAPFSTWNRLAIRWQLGF